MVGTTQYTSPPGFWTSEKGKNMRAVFEQFAKNNDFDPLVPDRWYRVSREAILRLPIGATIHRRYKGSFIRALMDVFPDIGLDQTKFDILPHRYWNVDNRRNFFIEVARSKGFDPLLAESWYSKANRTSMLTERRVASVLEAYGNSFVDTLVHLFPEIGIDPIRFASLSFKYWETEQNRKNVFLNFAKEQGMDPLLPDTWYSLMRTTALDIKDSGPAMDYYGKDVIKALVSLFPNMGLDPKHLATLQNAHWEEFIRDFITEKKFDTLVADNWYQMTRDPIIEVGNKREKLMIHHNRNKFVAEVMRMFPSTGLDPLKFSLRNNDYTKEAISRRHFFERFARTRGFNPKLPENWYSIQRAEFLKQKGAHIVLTHYGGSFVKGLMQVFPEIGLEAHKFATMSKNYWQNADNRREFLETTAKTHFGVDPLSAEHWYHLERGAFLKVKGVTSVLAYHTGDLVKALQDLFPELALDSSKFHQIPNRFWQDPKNRRDFFISFAEQRDFDPLVPTNWYEVSSDAFLATKGSAKVLQFHGKNLVKALLSLFPDIGLSVQKFPSSAYYSSK